MAKLEVFQNGNFNNGDPVFQIGIKMADGEYDIKVFEPMTTAEAKAKLKSMGGAAGADNNPVAVAMFNALAESLKSEELVEEVNPTSKTDLKMMTKIQLEDFAREFGVELDRRERKDALVKQAYKAQFDG